MGTSADLVFVWQWNMAAWAEQGYVIVCPNITGSTGYGLELVRGKQYRCTNAAGMPNLC